MAYFFFLCGKSEEEGKMQAERDGSCSVGMYVVSLQGEVI